MKSQKLTQALLLVFGVVGMIYGFGHVLHPSRTLGIITYSQAHAAWILTLGVSFVFGSFLCNPGRCPWARKARTTVWIAIAAAWGIEGVLMIISATSVDSAWLGWIVSAFGLTAGWDTWKKRKNDGTALSTVRPVELSRSDRTLFKALGAIVVGAGLILFGLGCWLSWQQWVKVARWPRVNAVLVRKTFNNVGADLIFHYEVNSLQYFGHAFRFGSENRLRAALKSYEPGTYHVISYDPYNPLDIEAVEHSNWELFFAPILGLFFVAGGVWVYRWSYERWAES